MKLVFYIGHHKVGSTSLQAYLSQNSLRLMQNGILYPAVESQGFARMMAKAAGQGDQQEMPPVNIREPHSALAYRMIAAVSERKVPPQFKGLPSPQQMYLALKNQVAALAPEWVVLCSEAFANFGAVDPNLIDQLLAQFPKTREVVIYCALRRPDDYLASWHGQRIKVGEKVGRLSGKELAGYMPTIHYDYSLLLEAWRERAQGARLELRNYAEVLAAGDSIEDFLARTGIEVPEGMLPTERANPSLPRAAMEFARQANHALQPRDAAPLRRHIMENRAQLATNPDSEIELYGAARREALIDNFAPVESYLAGLTDRENFFPDLAEARQPRPLSEAEATERLLARLDLERIPTRAGRDFVVATRRGEPTVR